MKITYSTEENLVEFAAIETGECFTYKDNVYIKMETLYTQRNTARNAVDLEDGSVDFFGYADLVHPINCELKVQK